MSAQKDTAAPLSRWPHRLAVALVCVVFPLIWVGGLVTTYKAGMAVPDWPGTYGYNLLLYPWTTWVAGPWNLFIEHGHRLLGASAGFVAIGLVASTFLTKQPVHVRWLAIGALALVILQGGLGGARVLLNARQIALIHGCVGPAFFAYCAAITVIFSPTWHEAKWKSSTNGASFTRSAGAGLMLTYAQLVLGAFLRHPAENGSPRVFQLVLLFHVVVGLALAGHLAGVALRSRRLPLGAGWLARPAAALPALVVVQLLLGVATLIVKYGWPMWLGGEWLDPGFTVTAKGFWSSMVITAHVANGSLILATLATLTTRSYRVFGSGFAAMGGRTRPAPQDAHGEATLPRLGVTT
jgi:cytochrome c oxidase assembly protein subunit 15